jgi:hypothetical protein
MNPPGPGPTLDEATATALVAILHNHIEAMKAWQRKLTTPYLPKPTHYPYTPVYTKPTLATTVHLMAEAAKLRLELLKVSNQFLEDLRRKEKQ